VKKAWRFLVVVSPMLMIAVSTLVAAAWICSYCFPFFLQRDEQRESFRSDILQLAGGRIGFSCVSGNCQHCGCCGVSVDKGSSVAGSPATNASPAATTFGEARMRDAPNAALPWHGRLAHVSGAAGRKAWIANVNLDLYYS
jgi:hypothetical protein